MLSQALCLKSTERMHLEISQLVEHGVDGICKHVLNLLLHEAGKRLESDCLRAGAKQRTDNLSMPFHITLERLVIKARLSLHPCSYNFRACRMVFRYCYCKWLLAFPPTTLKTIAGSIYHNALVAGLNLWASMYDCFSERSLISLTSCTTQAR